MRRRSAGLGEGTTRSPLAVRSARAIATPAPGAVIVEIRSSDEDDAGEILRRAQALAAAPLER